MTATVAAKVASIGAHARQAIRDGAAGELAAVFERCCYVTLDGNWLCIGTPAIGRGPLHMIFQPRQAKWPRRRGAPACVQQDLLRIDGIVLDLSRAAVWRPQMPSGWSRESLAYGLAALDALVARGLPEDGLACLMRDAVVARPAGLIAQAAQAPVLELQRLMRTDAREQACAASARKATLLVPLLGLGPGLTPSGDDLLGGAMIALRAVGRTDLCAAIWDAIAVPAMSLTNDISRAHLAAAAGGAGCAALHETLNAVMTGRVERIADGVRRLAAVGHTSGFDALAGAVIVLRAVPASGRD